jgi:hypothetical protein
MAAFFDEMSCHGKAHDAETEKSDFSHVSNPGGFAGNSELAGPCFKRERAARRPDFWGKPASRGGRRSINPGASRANPPVGGA